MKPEERARLTIDALLGQGGFAGGMQVVPSMAEHLPGMLAHQRQERIDLGVLAQQGSAYAFTQDYTFSSPSTAAFVVLGRNANGRVEWKDVQGTSLMVLQTAT